MIAFQLHCLINFNLHLSACCRPDYTLIPLSVYVVCAHRSYGILLWEIFSIGCMPYPSYTNAEVVDKVIEGYRMDCPKFALPLHYDLMKACWHSEHDSRPSFEEIEQVNSPTFPQPRPLCANLEACSLCPLCIQGYSAGLPVAVGIPSLTSAIFRSGCGTDPTIATNNAAIPFIKPSSLSLPL